MKFIEIFDGISVSADSIVSIERKDDVFSVIYLSNGQSYTSTFPYNTLVELVEMNYFEKETQKTVNSQVIEKSQQFFSV